MEKQFFEQFYNDVMDLDYGFIWSQKVKKNNIHVKRVKRMLNGTSEWNSNEILSFTTIAKYLCSEYPYREEVGQGDLATKVKMTAEKILFAKLNLPNGEPLKNKFIR